MSEVTNLSRLNQLLNKTKVPEFRKTISPSMNNVKWLRTVLLKDEDVDPELKQLLSLDPKSMLKPYENKAQSSSKGA